MTRSKRKKTDLSRRDFIKKTAVGAGTATLIGLGAKPGKSQDTVPVKNWDAGTDVVIIGTGFAGLVAGITAYDSGAKTLILEKAPKEREGGNSKVSGNIWWAPTDVDDAVKYITALCYGLTDPDSIEALARGMFENNEWLERMGIEPKPMGLFQPEYPELPGSSTVRTYFNARGTFGGNLYFPLRKQVSDRGIPVMYQTAATELVQNEKREIIGIKAVSEGKPLAIKARRGVIMACGGFEFAGDIQRQYLPGWPMAGRGSPYNEGDGIRMAQQAGASLWHMNNALVGVGALVIDDPDLGKIPVPISLSGSSCILIDQLGKRFMDESIRSRHGFGEKEHLVFFDSMKTQGFTRIPCYAVFDAGILKSPLGAKGMKIGWYNWYSSYEWSSDNRAEIEKGWIIEGDTIQELASKLGLVSDVLQKTITTYNQYCDTGIDLEFGRKKTSMTPIRQSPYVALKLYPAMYNTQGGPKRNALCQVVDPFDKAIPRLYSAGELGSFWGWMYNGGGNNAECLVTGRIAGANAASLSPW